MSCRHSYWHQFTQARRVLSEGGFEFEILLAARRRKVQYHSYAAASSLWNAFEKEWPLRNASGCSCAGGRHAVALDNRIMGKLRI